MSDIEKELAKELIKNKLKKKNRLKIMIFLSAVILILVSIFTYKQSVEERNIKFERYVKKQTKIEKKLLRKSLENLAYENKWIEIINNNSKVIELRVEKDEEVNLPTIKYLIAEEKNLLSEKDGDENTAISKEVSYFRIKDLEDGSQEKEKQFQIVYRYYNAPKIAILVDDAGMSMGAFDLFAEIKEKLTFAVIPFLPHTKDAKEKLIEAGHRIILHMPMEGSSDLLNKHTKGILLKDMTEGEVLNRFKKALKDIGEVDGFNNHMGSRFTTTQDKMEVVLEEAKNRNLFYIDSNTADTKEAYYLAKGYGIPTFYCGLFVDNNKDVASIKKQIKFAIKLAKQRNKLLVIGHFHENMAIAIDEMIPDIEAENIKLVYVKDLLD